MSSRPIAIFFEPGVPPPAVYLLTCQTDFASFALPHRFRQPQTVITQPRSESPHPTSRSSSRRCSPHLSSNTVLRGGSAGPYTKPPVKSTRQVTFDLLPGDEVSELTELSEHSESNSSSSSSSQTDPDEGLIPKPPGDAGRPNRGGYNLPSALDWHPADFSKLQKYVHNSVSELLDTSQSYQSQNENLRQAVRDSAMVEFPKLRQYEECWPVTDIMMLHLKNKSRQARMKAQKEEALKNAAALESTEKEKKRKTKTR